MHDDPQRQLVRIASKVDVPESLEVRVPMLDEDLFSFGLSLPHASKVTGLSCKRVLRSIAERWLPLEVARKPKSGFAIPVDTWIDREFKDRFQETVLDSSSRSDEFFHPKAYRPIVQAFCNGDTHPGISRQGLYQRAIMLLSLHLHLDRASSLTVNRSAEGPQERSVAAVMPR